ncbi:MAG: anti-sigma factor [Candidatus Devosia phytovorans]|uniref:Anti-sigma factor n=1 Tax=Candidatus Devosia phytovorans TaxID=3121372 RepID=A0AAJ6AZ32_9HYPH|nr:anti-sigma factor [Devosia sp.]WEK03682.1 MAG: anti-sigma factor [Devosia sp.]
MSTSDDIGDFGGRNALVAEYVLGLLSTSEHQRIGSLIDNDQTLRAERDFWISRFSALNDEFAETPVPAHLYPLIATRVFGEQPKSSFWENLLVWRSIAAGALAVAVAAVGFNLLQPAPDANALATQLVAALQGEGSNVQFVALYDGEGNVRLTALSGDDVPGSDYELWAIQGGNAPVSMGVIPVNARSTITLSPEIMAGWGEGSVLAISLEPDGGSPTGAPTGPVVASGTATQI